MAQLTPTETHAIKEIARAHAVSIEKLGLFARMARDEELRHLLREAQRKMQRHYEELRSYGTGEVDGLGPDAVGTGYAAPAAFGRAPGAWGGEHREGAGTTAFGRPSETAGFGQPQAKSAWTPETSPEWLSDRVIVTDLLECTKHLGTFSIGYAFECADRHLRRTFKQIADDHVDLGYDAFRYMESHGWYGLRQAQPQQISGIAQQYRSPQETGAPAYSATAGAPATAGTYAGANRPFAPAGAGTFGRNDWETAAGHGFEKREGRGQESR